MIADMTSNRTRLRRMIAPMRTFLRIRLFDFGFWILDFGFTLPAREHATGCNPKSKIKSHFRQQVAELFFSCSQNFLVRLVGFDLDRDTIAYLKSESFDCRAFHRV